MDQTLEGFDPALAQFRLSRIQLVNWGPFHGYHSIDIHRDGTLVTGPSGSGKSTLLDAIICVLMDRSVTFNAAAHDDGVGSKERTFYSYVRGQSGARRDANRGSRAIYQREGATWSGVALTWENLASASVTACRAMHMSRAATSNADITHSLIVAEQPFDLRDLQPAADQRLRQDAVRRALPHAATFGSEYGRYMARLSTLIGIRSQDGDSAKAIRLLHKAQSSKGVHNIDETFKRFVLDDSKVTERKDAAVEQFQSLSNGYADMVRAREQITLLTPLPELWDTYQQAGGDSTTLRALVDPIDGTTPAEAWVLGVHKDLLAARGDEQRALRDARRAAQQEAAATYAATVERIELLQARRHREGGAVLDELDREIGQLTAERDTVAARARELAAWCSVVGHETPGSAAALAALAGAAGSDAPVDDAALRLALHDAIAAQAELERAVAARMREKASFEGRTSNIPLRDLEVRRRILDATGLTERDLPFVGELVDLRAGEEEWRPAAERLLGGFGLGLAVDREHTRLVADAVDGTDLRGRVRYTPVDPAAPVSPPAVEPGTMAAKIEVAESPFAGWVAEQVARRFAHRCVREAADLAYLPQGVTLRGQIKHRGGLHEKDDRQQSRRDRIIGFDNAASIEDLTREIAELEAQLPVAAEQVTAAEQARDLAGRRRSAWQQIRAVSWADVDVTEVSTRLDAVVAQRDEAAVGDAVALIDAEIALLTIRRNDANHEARTAETQAEAADRAWSQAVSQEDGVAARLDSAPELTEDQRALLDAVAADAHPGTTLETVPALRRAVLQAVEARLTEARSAQTAAQARIAGMLGTYLTRWPAEQGDLTDQVDDAPDFLRRLEYLRQDDLPAAMDSWRGLMHRINQMGLSSLIQTLRDERLMIDDRITPVNDVLRTVPFGHDGYLQIVTTDVEPPASRAFKAEIDAILENTLGRELADDVLEERFGRIQRLMTRLDGTEPADREWQREVLDVKRHVRISAEEHRRGETEARVYEGVGATSGGEGQELIAATLGAALRYQLGGIEAVPLFGSVMVDEGFVKSDPDVTRRAIRALQSFGFQLLIAAPIDKYQSMEREFGSAYLIEADPAAGRAQARGLAIGFGAERAARVVA
ncbi:hypothetical protein AGMMS50218_05410 [Actinomycetota bacterium]|nr:hypothetical protein AGMMS50218_05410 [Actinomycetota bacterium]